MPYIDYEYYTEDYKGIQIDEDTFNRLVRRASEIIDMLTNYVIRTLEFERWASFLQEQVKKATAAQVEYLHTHGESNAMGAGELGQVSAGNFSYNVGSDGLDRRQKMVSTAVIEHLSPTCLLYQGVETL